LSIINNLGALYIDQDKLGKVEKIYKQALEKALRVEYILILNIVNNLGNLYKN
ncbi:uncharacterized protein BDZ99DRAFT_401754, partial [Mytilinidion resinicola]